MRRERTGGSAGNEILTSATAAVLTCLLLAEGLTILRLRSLLGPHMFIGLLLIPPVLLKLTSAGYRFLRYYAHSPAHREKGPPLLALRLMAPVLVAATIGVFASGVALLAVGHKSQTLLLLRKASFVVWGAVFGIHFLAYLPRVLRSLRADWGAARRQAVGGAGLRGTLVASAVGGGGAGGPSIAIFGIAPANAPGTTVSHGTGGAGAVGAGGGGADGLAFDYG